MRSRLSLKAKTGCLKLSLEAALSYAKNQHSAFCTLRIFPSFALKEIKTCKKAKRVSANAILHGAHPLFFFKAVPYPVSVRSARSLAGSHEWLRHLLCAGWSPYKRRAMRSPRCAHAAPRNPHGKSRPLPAFVGSASPQSAA